MVSLFEFNMIKVVFFYKILKTYGMKVANKNCRQNIFELIFLVKLYEQIFYKMLVIQ